MASKEVKPIVVCDADIKEEIEHDLLNRSHVQREMSR
jgi:hypothetical protein